MPRGERYRKRQEDGRCGRCGTEGELETATLCPTCAERRRENSRARRERLKAEGRCRDCGGEIASGRKSYTRCHECQFRHAMSNSRYRLKKRRESVRERKRAREERLKELERRANDPNDPMEKRDGYYAIFHKIEPMERQDDGSYAVIEQEEQQEPESEPEGGFGLSFIVHPLEEGGKP